MNQENSEIFSPDDLNQFQLSLSDKRISTQPIAAYASSVTESLKSLSIVTQGMMHQIKKQNQQYQKLVLLNQKLLQYLKYLRRELYEVLTKKN